MKGEERSAKFNQVSMKELFIRFVVGGTVVSCFAVLGDLLKPKSFAGLLGAAPSVGLSTLSPTVLKDGLRGRRKRYGIENR